MSLHDWIYSNYPADSAINGRYGALHIGVMVACVALIILIALLRKKDIAVRSRAIMVLAGCIFLLEMTRRIINLTRGGSYSTMDLLYILLPRPWCAISCWLTMYAAVAKKKILYNFSAMNGLLCALVFFAYPNVGFNHKVILFENFYSIATHTLLLITSVSMMTLELTDFRYESKDIRKTISLLVGVYAYATLEILLHIEPDPLYFMPGSDVQDFLGVDYPLFLTIYIGFLLIYFNAFYLVQKRITIHKCAGASQKNLAVS